MKPHASTCCWADIVFFSFQYFVSHIIKTSSLPPLNRNLFSSPPIANPLTALLCSFNVAMAFLFTKSQTLIKPVVSPDINFQLLEFSSPWNFKAETVDPCPLKECVIKPFSMSKTTTDPSEPPNANKVDVGSVALTNTGDESF
ncbi:hypothetical protein WICMUC_004423 [Wickerhamomyces mucosus]|uniref:Uncharacterized protein n=1 Tax=Wickerhamomyces mucosus TaxID=1378264 RepID=A0A9P8PJ12_9ASCO|nr:hypothetical protein WICMUC_004423 [Wickerhamomyces mucosus]